MERTFVIIKPSGVQRGLVGEVIRRFELKGLQLCGLKITLLDDCILNEHYAHLSEKSFFGRIKDSMSSSPVVLMCLAGVECIQVVRAMAGATNGRVAALGTIRGDFSMSIQENIVHTSDSLENAKIEIERFFKPNELFDYSMLHHSVLYANDECRDKILEKHQ